MRWSETVAAQCRWSESVEPVLTRLLGGEFDVLWEESEVDYQGSATVLVARGDMLAEYGWSYGSCSGCDGWEDEPAEKVTAEIESGVGLFNRAGARTYQYMLRRAGKTGKAAAIDVWLASKAVR